MLPQDFLERMKRLLGDEFPAFLKSYEMKHYKALRVNTQKTDRERFLRQVPFSLSPVPWAKDGFYYHGEDMPGKHPYHDAGVYYIQEPSAMAPAEYLMEGFLTGPGGEDEAADDETAPERILDLCAAPGGKSTQIALRMRGRGIFISNEIHPARAGILSENIERMGICNALVLNETPQKLAERFPAYFTRILVDAPCSGEGMFRKNEEACGEWSLSNVMLCAERQDEILDCAATMLSPGGRMVYSTCTFSPEENEGSIARFLKRHPEFSIGEAAKWGGMSKGVPGWGVEKEGPETAEEMGSLEKTIRLWPHRLDGEGHFLAVLRKEGKLSAADSGFCKTGLEKGIPEKELLTPQKGILEWNAFARETLRDFSRNGNVLLPGDGLWENGRYLRFGEQLYRIPAGMPAVRGLKVLRPGLHLGTIKKNRFEPSHALALALSPENVLHTADADMADEAERLKIRRYLRGETLPSAGETFPSAGEKGWYLITVDGYGIGWGRLAGGVMKNHYPKGLRKKR